MPITSGPFKWHTQEEIDEAFETPDKVLTEDETREAAKPHGGCRKPATTVVLAFIMVGALIASRLT